MNTIHGRLSAQKGNAEGKEPLAPDFLMAALRKDPKALAAFENLSPSHKREYVKWLVEAKREETREKRVASMLTRLAVGKAAK